MKRRKSVKLLAKTINRMPIITVYRKTSPWRYTSSCPEVQFTELFAEMK
ncbi:MAG TPA: hypothetical protein PKI14_19235 [Fervidobacterium sp.]|nr:hypothetical protein [Fervidobacterium sp.]